MPKIEQNIWITKDQCEVPVTEMEHSHLQTAFLHTTRREFELYKKMTKLWNQINTQNNLKQMLLNESKRRRIVLLYPDQIEQDPERWGKYFEAERKGRKVMSNDELNALHQRVTMSPGSSKAVLAPTGDSQG